MKKIIVLLALSIIILLLSACSSNVRYRTNQSNSSAITIYADFNVSEMDDYIYSWAQGETYDEALERCERQIFELYLGAVDEDEVWISAKTSLFGVKIEDNFITERYRHDSHPTLIHHVSITILKSENEHLFE